MTKKTIKEGVGVIIDASAAAIKNPLGTAKIISGYSTLKNGLDAGVTPAQMRAIFSDLQKYSDEKIYGFVEIGEDLSSGNTVIPSSIFNGPVGDLEPEK
ncbi:hypothetical protein [Xenorhabdus taiwanensis]|uniref:Uncharacterized protein n=1 Tax=Xenorhabdus taiwanensis TaxID=3085177 RepID=A0ABN7C5S3_9GAMM|nr:hypothetical protein TCT1_26100 [Xenorhabdus sp. TCT-1]